MFYGEYAHAIDDKGRLTIPAKFRAELAAGCVVTLGFDRNLMIYPKDRWAIFAQKTETLSVTKPEDRRLWRLVFTFAAEDSPDSQGRIAIPQNLRDEAGLKSEVVVAGIGQYIEVWSAEAWAEERRQISDPQTKAEGYASLDLSTAK